MKRYTLLLIFGIITLIIPGGELMASSGKGSGLTPLEAIEKLKEGNRRYIKFKRKYPHLTTIRIKETSSGGQHPFVTIIGCSDSRVPIEHIFDAGIGDIFVIRVAGNVHDIDEIGSTEYGVDHLSTPLMVVLGHTQCGAVTAVVRGDDVHGSIPMLVDNIIPAADRAKKEKGEMFTADLVNRAVELNVMQSISDLLKGSGATRKLVREKKLKVVGAVYQIESGKVKWLGEHPEQASLITVGKTGSLIGGLQNKRTIILMGVNFIVLILGFLLFVMKRHLVPGIKIRGRIFFSFILVIISLAIPLIVSGVSLVHSKGYMSILYESGVPILISFLFALLYAKSIIGSFKRVINALKESAAPVGTGEKS